MSREYDSVVDYDREEARSAARDAMPEDGPDPSEYADLADLPRVQLPDPYLCIDPWCPNAAAQPRHLHGTRPDGVRV